MATDKDQYVVTYPNLPVIQAAWRNTDESDHVLSLTKGCDYRTGRAELWKIEVNESGGKRIPPRNWNADMGGGLGGQANLEKGAIGSTMRQWEVTSMYSSRASTPCGFCIIKRGTSRTLMT